MKVKTHTFRLGKYKIDILDSKLMGMCEIPSKNNDPWLYIPNDNDKKSLQTIIHEALHAEGVSDARVHDGCGERIADLLWRLGWRRT